MYSCCCVGRAKAGVCELRGVYSLVSTRRAGLSSLCRRVVPRYLDARRVVSRVSMLRRLREQRKSLTWSAEPSQSQSICTRLFTL